MGRWVSHPQLSVPVLNIRLSVPIKKSFSHTSVSWLWGVNTDKLLWFGLEGATRIFQKYSCCLLIWKENFPEWWWFHYKPRKWQHLWTWLTMQFLTSEHYLITCQLPLFCEKVFRRRKSIAGVVSALLRSWIKHCCPSAGVVSARRFL